MPDPYEQMLREQLAQIEARNKLVSQPANTQPSTQAPSTNAPAVGLQQAIATEVTRQINEFKSTFKVPIAPEQEKPKLTEGAIKAAMMELFAASLKPAELVWLQQHYFEGAPGFAQFLQSASIKSVIQMGFETYKDFLEGKAT